MAPLRAAPCIAAGEEAAPSPCLRRAGGTGDIFPIWVDSESASCLSQRSCRGSGAMQSRTAGARFEPVACSSFSIGTRWARSSRPVHKNPPLEANGDPAQGTRCLWGPRKGPVSPESADIFQAGGAPGCSVPVGAVLWHVGGVFPERGGCCPGTAGAQVLVFGELPPFRRRIQLQPRGWAPPAARLAQQGHPGSRSRSPGHALLPALALGRAGRRRRGWPGALGGSASTSPMAPSPAFPWSKDGVNSRLSFSSSGLLVEGLKMRNATLGLTARDSEQHQDAGRQEGTALLCTGDPPSPEPCQRRVHIIRWRMGLGKTVFPPPPCPPAQPALGRCQSTSKGCRPA